VTPAEADGLLFDGTTYCAEELPMAWSAGGAGTVDAHERNAALLRLLGQLEEPVREPRDDKSGEPEWLRLEAKVDLLLHVVSTLAALQRPPPPVEHLVLSCRGLVWRAAPRALAVGDAGRLSLHLHPAVPLALELGARVIAVDDSLSPPRAWLAFDPPGETALAALERHTFRRHRRAVAGLRRAAAPA